MLFCRQGYVPCADRGCRGLSRVCRRAGQGAKKKKNEDAEKAKPHGLEKSSLESDAGKGVYYVGFGTAKKEIVSTILSLSLSLYYLIPTLSIIIIVIPSYTIKAHIDSVIICYITLLRPYIGCSSHSLVVTCSFLLVEQAIQNPIDPVTPNLPKNLGSE